MREQRKFQGGNKGLRGKKEGTNAKEEIQKIGRDIQGADNANGEIKRTRSKLNCEGESKVLRRKIKAQEPRRKVKRLRVS